MLFFYESNSLKSGIYEIKNRLTNRSYIGQSKRFKERWQDHKRSLLNNKGVNKFLQNDFNKCIEKLENDDFIEFHILEVMENSTKEERLKREEWWINQAKKIYKKNNIYNFNLKPTKEGKFWSDTPEKTLEKIRQNTVKMWSDPIIKQKISNSIKKSKNNIESRDRQKEISKTYWKSQEKYFGTLYNAELNIKEKIYCIIEFSRKYNLDFRKVSKLLKGKRNSHQGWCLDGNKIKRMTKHTFLNPNNEIIVIDNLSKFCRVNNLLYRSMQDVKKGRQKQHRGWRVR